jgi:hypothetical protein
MLLTRGLAFWGFLWLCASVGAQAAVQISAETQIRSLYVENKLKPGAASIVIVNHLDLSNQFANEFRTFDGVTSMRVLTLPRFATGLLSLFSSSVFAYSTIIQHFHAA